MALSNRVYRMFHGYLRDFYDAIWRIQPTKWPIVQPKKRFFFFTTEVEEGFTQFMNIGKNRV